MEFSERLTVGYALLKQWEKQTESAANDCGSFSAALHRLEKLPLFLSTYTASHLLFPSQY